MTADGEVRMLMSAQCGSCQFTETCDVGEVAHDGTLPGHDDVPRGWGRYTDFGLLCPGCVAAIFRLLEERGGKA